MQTIMWTDTVTYDDPGSGRSFEMTLSTVVQEAGELPPNQFLNAGARLSRPIDLGDGKGLRTRLDSSDLAKLADLWEADQARLRRASRNP